ncbi:MAG: SbcC/MukB-like Walker B domain-containing protein, partial [Gemmatimonadales bacterium]
KLKLMQDRLRQARTGLNLEIRGLEQGLPDEQVLMSDLAEKEAGLAVAGDRLARIAGELEAARNTLAGAGPRWTQMVELKERVIALQSDLKLCEQREIEARREFERLDREMAEAMTAQTELEAMRVDLDAVVPLKAEQEKLTVESQRAGERKSLVGQLEEVEAQIVRIDRRLAELSEVETELAAVRAEVAAAQDLVAEAESEEERLRTVWIQDKQDVQTKLTATVEQYRDLERHRKHMRELGPQGDCPMCQRKLGGEFGNVVDSLSNQLEEIEINGKFFRQRVKQLEGEPDELVAAVSRLKDAGQKYERQAQAVARLESLLVERDGQSELRSERTAHREKLRQQIEALPDTWDEERFQFVRDELKRLDPVVQRAAVLRGKGEGAERLVVEAAQAEQELSAREKQTAALRNRIADAGLDEEEFARSRQAYDGAEAEVRRLEVEVASAEGEVKAATMAHEAVAGQLKERRQKAAVLERLKAEVRTHEELDGALKDLRAELNTTMRPEISEIASTFLNDLTDGRYQELELDEQFRMLIVEEGLAKEVISGGEEDIANLVVRVAISQMVAERSGHPLSLLVLDEVFGSLDDDRRQNVLNLLRGLGDRFPQVILISHIESVRTGADRVLGVTYDEGSGRSTLTEMQADEHLAA